MGQVFNLPSIALGTLLSCKAEVHKPTPAFLKPQILRCLPCTAGKFAMHISGVETETSAPHANNQAHNQIKSPSHLRPLAKNISHTKIKILVLPRPKLSHNLSRAKWYTLDISTKASKTDASLY